MSAIQKTIYLSLYYVVRVVLCVVLCVLDSIFKPRLASVANLEPKRGSVNFTSFLFSRQKRPESST